MFTAGDTWKGLFEQFDAKDNDMMDAVKRESRKAYYELCAAASWESMRKARPSLAGQVFDKL